MTDDLCCEFSHNTITSWKRICACLLTYLLTYWQLSVSGVTCKTDTGLGMWSTGRETCWEFPSQFPRKTSHSEPTSTNAASTTSLSHQTNLLPLKFLLLWLLSLLTCRSNGRCGGVSGCLAQQWPGWCCFWLPGAATAGVVLFLAARACKLVTVVFKRSLLTRLQENMQLWENCQNQ